MECQKQPSPNWAFASSNNVASKLFVFMKFQKVNKSNTRERNGKWVC